MRGMGPGKQIFLYLAILVVIAAPLNLLLVRGGGMSGPQAMSLMLAIMWAPALAAVITRLIAARTLAGLGWAPGPPRYLLAGYAVPLLYGAIPFLIAAALGYGTLSLDNWSEAAIEWGVPASPLFGFVMLATINVLFGLVTATGEEIGWRGFLVPALAKLRGFWGVVTIGWLIWLLYHLPLLILSDYNSGQTPVWVSLICFAALLYPVSAFMAWLRLRSDSFWPAALAHAAHNAFIQSVFASAMVPDGTTAWLVGEFGIITPLAAAALILPILYRWPGQSRDS